MSQTTFISDKLQQLIKEGKTIKAMELYGKHFNLSLNEAIEPIEILNNLLNNE